MIKPENTVLFERSAYDLNKYWLELDSLHNLDYDMFFSPFQKYTCQAGCKICYISKQLDESAVIIDQYAPVEITPQIEETWNFWFDKFSEIGYSDDLALIKTKFPHIYSWLLTNSYKFKYCMTDNAILRQHDILINEMKFAGIMDISISDQFLDTHPTMWNNIKSRLFDLKNKYNITQIKFLITRPGPRTRSIANLIDWVDTEGLQYLIHHDFTDESNLKHEVLKASNYNDWVMCQNNRLYEIQKETVSLFGDRWFFSSQDATSRKAFWIMNSTDNQDQEALMYYMLIGKQYNYKNMFNTLQPTTILASNFKKYFSIPSTYKVNRHYNFIPRMLLSANSVFVKNLLTKGWLNTDNGLYKSGLDNVVSILEPIKQEKE